VGLRETLYGGLGVMRINCLGCGHMLDIGDNYDEFDGSVKCNICGAILDFRSEGGNIKTVKLVDPKTCCPKDES
jgi:ribosomal protein S27E